MNDGLQLESSHVDTLIQRLSSMVYRLAFSYARNRNDAEDIMQEVFLRFVKYKPEFNDGEHEKAWFIKVTINTAKSLHTSPWRKKTVLMPAEEVNAEKQEDISENSYIAEAVAKLNDKQRLCIHLFYYEGYAIVEIAQMTGFNESTVKSHLRRARECLKKELGEANF
ncbi:MAG: RNA polymerase sigma factor [Oscillospiraceae bacterium]|nr:RNA polymerase sigma factor [Oscillospiraceae bacterium]